MPSGKELYFTVWAENSAGARAQVSCKLPTYDTTLPSGRITPEFMTTSNPSVIRASAQVHDDSVITAAYLGVGFGKGQYSDQLVSWRSVDLKQHTYTPHSMIFSYPT